MVWPGKLKWWVTVSPGVLRLMDLKYSVRRSAIFLLVSPNMFERTLAHDRVDYVENTGSAWELLINKPCCFGPMLLSVRVTDTGAGVKYTNACSRWFSPSQFIRIILLLYLYINNFLPSLSPSLLIFHLIPKFSLSLSLISSLLYHFILNDQSEEGGGKRERRKTRRVQQMAKKKEITKNYWREGGRRKSTKRKRR